MSESTGGVPLPGGACGIPVAGDGSVQERVEEHLGCLSGFGERTAAPQAEYQGGGVRVFVLPVGAWRFEGARQGEPPGAAPRSIRRSHTDLYREPYHRP
jgi:hypothetical protein